MTFWAVNFKFSMKGRKPLCYDMNRSDSKERFTEVFSLFRLDLEEKNACLLDDPLHGRRPSVIIRYKETFLMC